LLPPLLRERAQRFDRGLAKRWWLVAGGGVLVAAAVLLWALWFIEADARPKLELGPELHRGRDPFANALLQTVGSRLSRGHEVEVIHDGAVFDELLQDIASARTSIHILMYIWDEGSVSDALVAAIDARARAGVECRILVDAVGGPDFDDEIAPSLQDAGCETLIFRPAPELSRNHRKIIVVDGRIGYTGGFGFRDEWLGSGRDEDEWRDVAVRFRGPTVADAQQAFAENWLESGGPLLPEAAFPSATPVGSARAAFVTSTASDAITRADRLVQLMIAAANERLWIANAYFVPSQAIRDQLVERAMAGVDVRVLTAGEKSDSKTSWGAQNISYDVLTDHGIRVWEYQPSMLHSKTMVVDDELALIGSINVDPLSLRELEEGALVVEDRATNDELARAFLEDCEYADEEE
jgi:cardiolipin synthase A/B